MPRPRSAMRKIREVLRLSRAEGLSPRHRRAGQPPDRYLRDLRGVLSDEGRRALGPPLSRMKCQPKSVSKPRHDQVIVSGRSRTHSPYNPPVPRRRMTLATAEVVQWLK